MDAAELRPKLFLGGPEAAKNVKALTLQRVTHVLSVGEELPVDEKQMAKRKVAGRSCGGRVYLQEGGKKDPFVRLFLPVGEAESFAEHLDETRLFISEGLAQGKVLVHCSAAHGLSAAVCAAFLMQKEKLSLGKALLHIKELRPAASVKQGVLQQLRSLEEQIGIAPASPRTLEAAGCLKKEREVANPKVFLEISLDGQSAGRLEIELFAELAPRTCENFRCLCTGEKGRGAVSGRRLTYLGSVFHRVIPGLVCIGGDITMGDGTGGESIFGHSFPDESFDMQHDTPGVLSMANSGPDSNGSQFLLCLGPCPQLDGKNVAFGRVTSGLEVLKLVEECGSESGETSKRVTILDCGEVPQPGRQVKRPKLADSADAQKEVATVLQVLRKHRECKKATSWRSEQITCSPAEARDHLAALRQHLASGPEAFAEKKRLFEEAAKEHSDCKSARKGGLLDPFERGMMTKAFEDVAFALEKGQLSEVFSTKQGEHLLLRIA